MAVASPKPENGANGAAAQAPAAPAGPPPVAVQGQVPVGAVLPPALVYETVRSAPVYETVGVPPSLDDGP